MTPFRMNMASTQFAGRDRYGSVRDAASIVGRLKLGALGLLVVLQICLRLLHRAIPSPLWLRLSSALDAPIRQRFLNARIIARRVGLRSGMRVFCLDVGSGAVPEAIESDVGPDGRVEAVSLDPDARQRARVYLASEAIENVGVISGFGNHIPFADQSFDAACVVSSFGRLNDPQSVLAEVRRVLRPAGRLSISEVVSDPAYVLRKTMISWAEHAGFELLESFGDALAYTVNFRKPMTAPAG